MKYRGKFKPKNPHKYVGDVKNIVYRSGWELSTFIWCDNHQDILEWSSEEFFIPYRCSTDNKIHRYFVDLKIKFAKGQVYIIEIKPRCQLFPPTRGRKREKTFLNEMFQYHKNVSKWNQAQKYAESRGWIFQIWHEDILKKLGVKILTG
jgi:hypothetical protein